MNGITCKDPQPSEHGSGDSILLLSTATYPASQATEVNPLEMGAKVSSSLVVLSAQLDHDALVNSIVPVKEELEVQFVEPSLDMPEKFTSISIENANTATRRPPKHDEPEVALVESVAGIPVDVRECDDENGKDPKSDEGGAASNDDLVALDGQLKIKTEETTTTEGSSSGVNDKKSRVAKARVRKNRKRASIGRIWCNKRRKRKPRPTGRTVLTHRKEPIVMSKKALKHQNEVAAAASHDENKVKNSAVGEVVWYKIRSGPWWPARFTCNKNVKSHIRTKDNHVEYYVTPFANKQSARWMTESHVLAFRGRKEFEVYAERQLSRFPNPGVRRSRVIARFVVNETMKAEWESVVSDAEAVWLKEQSLKETRKDDDGDKQDQSSKDSEILKGKAGTKKKKKKSKTKLIPKALSQQRKDDTSKSVNSSKKKGKTLVSDMRRCRDIIVPRKRIKIPIKPRFVGDLVWFKIVKEPFWPGRISNDEATQTHVCKRGANNHYHVTPFQSGSSGKWVISNLILDFKGRQQLNEHIKQLSDRFPEHSYQWSQVQGKYYVKPSKMEEWERVVREAETYLTHPIDSVLPTKNGKESHLPLPSTSVVATAKSSESNVMDEQEMAEEAKFWSEAILPFLEKAKSRPRKNALTPSEEGRRKNSLLRKLLLQDSEAQVGDADAAVESSSPSKRDLGPESRNEKVCPVCEKLILVAKEGLRCEGNCQTIIHASCVKSTVVKSSETGGYKCEECTKGIHSCFVCKKSQGEVRRCSVGVCGKFYHSSCLSSFRYTRVDEKSITCSLHFCLSCALSNIRGRASRGRLYRCLKCPVAYHSAEGCLAAGSVILSSSVIMCPRHYEPKSSKGKQLHVNVNWCFVCSTGGSLICCETCPASFHAECLQIIPPEGSYYCAECVAGTQPKYGDIVWVKLGSYRWWPAKIYNPRTVPPNIQNLPHQVGEFPVRFFGTHDYHWTFRSRVFQFLEGDQSAQDNASNRLSKMFHKALDEALIAFKEWKVAKESRDAQYYERDSLKPPPYKAIKANKPVGKVQVFTADPSQMVPCECDPNSENPCGSDSDCLNRMLMFECHPAVCSAGERCQNQRFEKRQYVPAEPYKVEGKGWGLRNLVDIKKGQFVNEYVGELIDEEECRRRMKKMHEEVNTNYYFLTIDKDRIIDAAHKGNLSRFMNHSCQPNCETHKWTVNGDTRVGLFAVSDIPTGTELTFNYNLDCLGNDKTKCKCAAPNCSGFIGERPKNTAALKRKNASTKESPKKKRKKCRVLKVEHEDECFRCGLDGELLMCDRRNCPKAFHLSCLKLDKPPHGRWDCPWHHCDVCGKSSSALCSICPNSFCKDHVAGNTTTVDGTIYCNEHNAESILQNAQEKGASSKAAPLPRPVKPEPDTTTATIVEEPKKPQLDAHEVKRKKKREKVASALRIKLKLNGALMFRAVSTKVEPKPKKKRGPKGGKADSNKQRKSSQLPSSQGKKKKKPADVVQKKPRKQKKKAAAANAKKGAEKEEAKGANSDAQARATSTDIVIKRGRKTLILKNGLSNGALKEHKIKRKNGELSPEEPAVTDDGGKDVEGGGVGGSASTRKKPRKEKAAAAPNHNGSLPSKRRNPSKLNGRVTSGRRRKNGPSNQTLPNPTTEVLSVLVSRENEVQVDCSTEAETKESVGDPAAVVPPISETN